MCTGAVRVQLIEQADAMKSHFELALEHGLVQDDKNRAPQLHGGRFARVGAHSLLEHFYTTMSDGVEKAVEDEWEVRLRENRPFRDHDALTFRVADYELHANDIVHLHKYYYAVLIIAPCSVGRGSNDPKTTDACEL